MNKRGVSNTLKMFVEVIIGILLVPLMYSFVSSANITDSNGALLISLVPFFFIMVLVYKSAQGLV